MTDKEVLRLEQRDGEWVLAGEHAARFALVDEYLAHLLDRNYSPATVRSYGYDLLAFCRWLARRVLAMKSSDSAGKRVRPLSARTLRCGW